MTIDLRAPGPGPSRVRRLALVLVALALSAEALYPFALDLPRWRGNEVRRSVEGELRFGGHNVARTSGPPGFLAPVREGQAMRLELEIRSARREQGGPARIFSVSRDYWNAALLVAQDGGDLLVAVNRFTEDPTRPSPLRVRGLFAEPGWHRLEVRLEPRRVEVAVDGETRDGASLPEGFARSWSDANRLALGDEPLGNRPWRGEIRVASVELEGRALDVLRDPALAVPERAFYWPERLRRPGQYLLQAEPAVLGLHFLSYLPLGVLAGLGAVPRREIRRALGVAAALAIALQLAKIGIAGRHPGGVDVVAAIAGAGLGGWLVAAGRRRREVRATD